MRQRWRFIRRKALLSIPGTLRLIIHRFSTEYRSAAVCGTGQKRGSCGTDGQYECGTSRFHEFRADRRSDDRSYFWWTPQRPYYCGDLCFECGPCAADHQLCLQIRPQGYCRRTEHGQYYFDCFELGYIQIPNDTLIDIDHMRNYPDDQLVLITTGSQGETMAALSRMANNTHRRVSIKPGDTIVFSSSPIPGKWESRIQYY